jgi:small subunit ribosomal protein S4
MKRKRKIFSRPKKRFDKPRIIEEEEIKREFGLKSKREIWKADSKVKSMREKAKRLISAGQEEQKALFSRLKKMGFEVNSISDVLSLDKKDYLRRRLQTILVTKNLAKTSREARQLIAHKKVLVEGKSVNSPSYIVPVDLESKITIKRKNKKAKVEAKGEDSE